MKLRQRIQTILCGHIRTRMVGYSTYGPWLDNGLDSLFFSCWGEKKMRCEACGNISLTGKETLLKHKYTDSVTALL